jgi:hypothetical protein
LCFLLPVSSCLLLPLKNVDAVSASVAAGSGESMFGSMVVPAIRAREFLFTSRSDAV